jgi:hypothetical protein
VRQFLVLGHATKDRNCEGEPLYLGPVRSEALAVLRTDEKYARRTLHDLSEPEMQWIAANTVSSDSDDDPDEGPGLSKGARKLIAEHQLTDEQVAEIKPTGASGGIVKTDVEKFLETIKVEDVGDSEPSDEESDGIQDDEADTVSTESEDDPEDDENGES